MQDSEAQVGMLSEKLREIEHSVKEVTDARKVIQARKQNVFDAQKKLQSLALKIGAYFSS